VRILLLSARPETASNRRLAAAAAARGVALDVVDATTIVVSSEGGRWPLEPGPGPDAVLARVGNWRPDSLLAVLEAFTGAGAATPNPAPAVRVGRDHWRTVAALAAAGLPVPTTLAGADPEALAAAVRTRLRFPVVVKQRRSRMGVGVILCRSADHLEAVLDSLWRLGDEIIVQEHVETEGRSDRLLVVGDRVVAAARFSAVGGEWRSNAARGGRGEPIEPDRAAAALAVAATRTIGLGVCGVDLLRDDERTLVGEVNPTPGFSFLEATTGIDVAAAIVDHLVELGGARPTRPGSGPPRPAGRRAHGRS
jgi:RimK family alpha-L-glutamate ligase